MDTLEFPGKSRHSSTRPTGDTAKERSRRGLCEHAASVYFIPLWVCSQASDVGPISQQGQQLERRTKHQAEKNKDNPDPSGHFFFFFLFLFLFIYFLHFLLGVVIYLFLILFYF